MKLPVREVVMPFSSAVVAARLQGFLEQDRQGELEYNRGAALTRVHRLSGGSVLVCRYLEC